MGADRPRRHDLPGGLGAGPGRHDTGCTPSSTSSTAHRALGTRPGDVRRLIEHELEGESPFPAPLALNVVPFVGHHVGDGWTSEEVKVRQETRKILDIPDLPSRRPACGCPSSRPTRSPCMPPSPTGCGWPTPARRSSRPPPSSCSTTPTSPSSRPRTTSWAPTRASSAGSASRPSRRTTLDLFICGDNLRKGAALNMVQTAELVARELARAERDGSGIRRRFPTATGRRPADRPHARRATMGAQAGPRRPDRAVRPHDLRTRPPHRRSAP